MSEEERIPRRELAALSRMLGMNEGPNLTHPQAQRGPREGTVGLCCHLEGGGSTAAMNWDSPWGTSRSPLLSFTVSPLPRSLTAAAPPRKWAWRRPPFLTRGRSSSGSPQGGPPAGPGHSAGSCPQVGSPGCYGLGHTAGR